jgi:hypothetical protein
MMHEYNNSSVGATTLPASKYMPKSKEMLIPKRNFVQKWPDMTANTSIREGSAETQNTRFTSQGRVITRGLTRTEGVGVDHGSDFTTEMWYDTDTRHFNEL